MYLHLSMYGHYLISKYTQTCTCRKSSHTTSYISSGTALSWVLSARIQGHVQFIQCRRLPNVSVCACVCSKSSLKPLGQIEVKSRVEPQWDRGGKFIQMIPVFCCSSFEYCQPMGAGAFHRDFTTNVALQFRGFSRALEIKKLKAPLFHGPEGAGDTND